MNEQQKRFIINNYSKLSQKQLGHELGVSATMVFRWMRELKLRRRHYTERPKKVFIADGFFHHDKKLATI